VDQRREGLSETVVGRHPEELIPVYACGVAGYGPLGPRERWSGACGVRPDQNGFIQSLNAAVIGRDMLYVCRRSHVRDGSRPPATGLQEQAANHRKRLWSRAMVVSVTEKVLEKHQVWIKKTNTSEPPFKCRKSSDGVKTGGIHNPRTSLAETCIPARRHPA